MNFRRYLAELNMATGQKISVANSESIMDFKVRDAINQKINHELTDLILSPESGIQKIRKVLLSYGLDMPALYDTDEEGDELVLDVESFGDNEQLYLYIIYYLEDDGRYDFYAELTDDEGLDEIMSDEEEDEEE